MSASNEKLLIVDDDPVFCQVMQRALTRRGFIVTSCQNIEGTQEAIKNIFFEKAIIDLKIAQQSGLALLKILKNTNPNMEIVILTGYSSISTAVEAIKLGAINYFCKPIEVDEILLAFNSSSQINEIKLPETPPSLDRLEWERIQKVLQDNAGNISATARTLGMHRRTLQRKLQKKPVTN